MSRHWEYEVTHECGFKKKADYNDNAAAYAASHSMRCTRGKTRVTINRWNDTDQEYKPWMHVTLTVAS